ncbi:hypothetical protein SFRURICE_001906, partial [Spodoptera frugiperda]
AIQYNFFALPHTGIFSCILGTFKNIQVHIHVTPRPEKTICGLHEELFCAGIERTTRLAAAGQPCSQTTIKIRVILQIVCTVGAVAGQPTTMHRVAGFISAWKNSLCNPQIIVSGLNVI